MLVRLIYYSENHLAAGDGRMIRDLNAILSASNRNNKADDITGALIFDTLWFVQILEGEREAVNRRLHLIMQDERHEHIVVMDARPIERRLFGNWWMGVAMLRGDQSALCNRYCGGDRLNPMAMTGDDAVALALELASVGLERHLAEPV